MSDYKEILSSIGYELKDIGNTLRGVPIYRDSDNDTSLCVYKDTGHFQDYGSDTGGSFEDLIKLSLGFKDLKEVKTWLESNYDYNKLSTNAKPKLRTIKIFSNDILLDILPRHDYWINRGISLDVIKQFKGGEMFCGRMVARYTTPIFNSKNQVIGLSGRDLYNNPNRPKVKIIGQRKFFVYPAFLNKEILKQKKEVILVESVSEMFSLYECGIKNVLVLFGINISCHLIKYLIAIDTQKVIIAVNNDKINNDNAAGNNAALKIQDKLTQYFDKEQIEIKLPQKCNDWNETLMKFGKEQILEEFK